MSEEITDPSLEICEAIRKLLTHPAENTPTWNVFRTILGNKIATVEFWEVLSALHVRVLDFRYFASGVRDPEFSDPARTLVLAAVDRFTRFFEPENQAQAWHHSIANYLNADDALHLEWFSVIAKRYRPLRKLSEKDRQDIIAKINEVLETLQTRDDIPEWAKVPLTDGLRRMRLVLDHLLFFGMETAIDELSVLFQQTSALEDQFENANNAPNGTTGGARSQTILSILNVVALAVNLFCMADQTNTAFKTYKGWVLTELNENPKLPKPTQLLITGPKSGNGPPPTDAAIPNLAIEAEAPRIETETDGGAKI